MAGRAWRTSGHQGHPTAALPIVGTRRQSGRNWRLGSVSYFYQQSPASWREPSPTNSTLCFKIFPMRKPLCFNCQTHGQKKCIHQCFCSSHCFPHKVRFPPWLTRISLTYSFKLCLLLTNFFSFLSSLNLLIFPLSSTYILLSIGVWVDNLFFCFFLQHLKNIVLPAPSAYHGVWREACFHLNCFSEHRVRSHFSLNASFVLGFQKIDYAVAWGRCLGFCPL